jgi:membrane-associated phospholipid phosphatase
MIPIAVAYLVAVTGLMVWRGIVLTPDYLLLLMVPIALLSGRFLPWLADWLPFVALLMAWEAMRGFAPRLGVHAHNGALKPELFLFHGYLPTAVLQSWLDHGTVGQVLNVVGLVLYICHFPMTIWVGLVIWIRSRTVFLSYSTALLGMCCAAFVVFLLVPTTPPWYAADTGFVHGVTRILSGTLPGPVSPYYRSLDPNEWAALPSLHAAMPFLGFLAMRQVYRRGAWLMGLWTLGVWFVVVYLGEHYVLDVVAGAVFASVAWYLTKRYLYRHIAAMAGDTAQRAQAAQPAQPAST